MNIFLTTLLCLSSTIALSQDTTFLGADLNEVSRAKASFYKIVERQKADTNRAKEITYYISGKIKSERDYSDYRKKTLDGKSKSWFENGQIATDIDFTNGKFNGMLLTFWKTGIPKRIDKYENDSLIEGKCFNSDGKEKEYFAYEIMPEFIDFKDVYSYIVSEVKYPEQARKQKTQGKVWIDFAIDKDGSVTDVQIKRGVSEDLDQEAFRVIMNMPKWKPGLNDGEPVKVFYTVPISFLLR